MYYKVHNENKFQSTNTILWENHTGCPNKVLPFDKEWNNSFSSVVKQFLDPKYLLIDLDFDSSTTQTR